MRPSLSLPLLLTLSACAAAPRAGLPRSEPGRVGPVPLSAVARIIGGDEVRDERPGRGMAVGKTLPFALAVTQPMAITPQGLQRRPVLCSWDEFGPNLRFADEAARVPPQVLLMGDEEQPEQVWAYAPTFIGKVSSLKEARREGQEVLYVAHLCTEGDRTALSVHHGQWGVPPARGFILVVKRVGDAWVADSLRLHWKS